MNVFRRLPLYRLLILIAVAIAAGVSATALAFALDSGPIPAKKPLAQAIHDALTGPSVQGVSARITFTNHLIEGASIAANAGGKAGGLASSPLLTGASGRLWIAKDGRVRIELQSEKGDSEIVSDGHTVSLYDASSNTLYRYTPKQEGSSGWTSYAPTGEHDSSSANAHEAPSVAKVEEAIARAQQHVLLSGATPTDVAGQPAYTVRFSPKEGGSLIGGAEVSFDANHGTPLRAAIYSSTSSSPVIELAASEISYGAVDGSVFSLTPPAGAKIEEVSAPAGAGAPTAPSSGHDAHKPDVTTYGHGLSSIAVFQHKSSAGSGSGSGWGSGGEALEGLPKVNLGGGTSASELRTELGTVLSFERAGVRYVVAGSVTPAALEAFARGL